MGRKGGDGSRAEEEAVEEEDRIEQKREDVTLIAHSARLYGILTLTLLHT